MTIFTNFLTTLILAMGLVLFVVFAIQNVTPTSLKFLLFESIQLPISVLLTFCFALGLLLGAFLPLFWKRPVKRRSHGDPLRGAQLDDLEDEFDFE
jgi:uncharacterized integral membrane protein